MNTKPLLSKSTIALDSGIDLRELLTDGTVLQISEDYNDTSEDYIKDSNDNDYKSIDFIGKPVKSFDKLDKEMINVDNTGFVKKKILEEGGGLPLHENCTVSIEYSGYWENDLEPFDIKSGHKPLVVDLKNNGLLPGLQIAIKSMLVGEMSIYLLSYKVMYGEMGMPPRVKPKADCVFYIKLLKSILTPEQGEIVLSEPNMFQRVHHEVKLCYSSGIVLHNANNFLAATKLFRRAVNMLHKCRLANIEEEKIQEKLLVKLYLNLAVCYNKAEQPLRSCIACNELKRLNRFWNNGKALFQNAKSLRMIGEFEQSEKRLRKAMKLCPNQNELQEELKLLNKMRKSVHQSKLFAEKITDSTSNVDTVSDDFKKEVDNLIKNFKDNLHLQLLTLPMDMNSAEINYVKEACERERLYCNRIAKKFALDKVIRQNSEEKQDIRLEDDLLHNTILNEILNDEIVQNEK